MDDLISRQWLMECVNEGWIKFDTEKDENRFIHLVRDIAPSAQPESSQVARDIATIIENEKDMRVIASAQPDIVACGDCIHWICHDRRCRYWNHGVKPLDWCCHAERRTDG